MTYAIEWRGIEDYSVEDCTLLVEDTKVVANSCIESKFEGIPFIITYSVFCDQYWQVLAFYISYTIGNQQKILRGMRSADSN